MDKAAERSGTLAAQQYKMMRAEQEARNEWLGAAATALLEAAKAAILELQAKGFIVNLEGLLARMAAKAADDRAAEDYYKQF